MPFKIALLSDGSDSDFWDTLDDLDISEPDYTYQPYAEIVPTLAGSDYGRGFAIATWSLNIHNAARLTLRGFCPGTSANVYISTPTNEDDASGDPIFKDFQAVIHWMKGEEDKNVRYTIGVDLTFDHLVEVV